MPRSRKNTGTKAKRADLGLSHIMALMRFIAIMTGSLLFVSVLFFLITPKTSAGNVVYTLTIGANLVAFCGSIAAAIILRKKDTALSIMEQEKFKASNEKAVK